MNLKIHPDEALKMLHRIPHKKLQAALPSRWRVTEGGTVQQPSIFWLLCWCVNGLNSERTRIEAVSVWNAIMPISFFDYEPTINYEEARRRRYDGLPLGSAT